MGIVMCCRAGSLAGLLEVCRRVGWGARACDICLRQEYFCLTHTSWLQEKSNTKWSRELIIVRRVVILLQH